MTASLYQKLWHFTLDNIEAIKSEKKEPSYSVVMRLWKEKGCTPSLSVGSASDVADIQSCVESAIECRLHPMHFEKISR